jgi:hypothetical protein
VERQAPRAGHPAADPPPHHPKARPETPATPPATGIDYLGIIAAEHDAAQRRRINYQALTGGEQS